MRTSPEVSLFKKKGGGSFTPTILISTHISAFAYTHLSQCAYIPTEAQRRPWTPLDWSYRWLWVLESSSGLLEEQPVLSPLSSPQAIFRSFIQYMPSQQLGDMSASVKMAAVPQCPCVPGTSPVLHTQEFTSSAPQLCARRKPRPWEAG